MVMKISAWGYKLSSKAMAMSHYTPDMFIKSQWQRSAGISVYYLIYRWLMACAFFTILVASLLEVGRPGGGPAHHAKWAIYLTHWGFTLCTVQALFAAYLVTRAHCHQSDPEKEEEAMKMCHSLRVYWIMHNCATVGAFAITAIYWLFVFNPAENKLDALNLLVHAGNSVLMLMDLTVVSHPIRLIDFYWPISFSIIYVIFNFIYFLAGGTDGKGRVYIYNILNWEKPGWTLLVVLLCVVFVLIVHIGVCVFCLLRSKLAELLRRRQAEITDAKAKSCQGIANEIPINDLV